MKSIGKAILGVILMAVVANLIHMIGGAIIFRQGAKAVDSAVFLNFYLLNLYSALIFFVLCRVLARAIPGGGLIRCVVFSIMIWLIASIPEGASEWIKSGTGAGIVIGERIEDLAAFLAMGIIVYFFVMRKPKARVVNVNPA